jgi:lysophospholipase L1-like esterase
MVLRNNLLLLKCIALAFAFLLIFQFATIAERFNLFRRLAVTSLVRQMAGKYVMPQSEKIYFYGDSLTAGGGASFLHDFPTLISFLYGRSCVNMGFPSETSTQIRDRFLRRKKSGLPEHVVFWVGRNNIDRPEEVKRDLAEMVADLSPGSRYLVLGVTNADTERERIGGSNFGDAANINDYLRARFKSLSKT